MTSPNTRGVGGSLPRSPATTSRTSTTVPTGCEPASTTRSPDNLLSCITASRNVFHDTVAQPTFHPISVECHVIRLQPDDDTDCGDQLPWDLLEALERWKPAEDPGRHDLARQNCGGPGRVRSVGNVLIEVHTVEHDVVHDADRRFVIVEQLTVQQV